MVASATLTNAQINIGDSFGTNIVNPNLNVFPEEITSVKDYVKEQKENLRVNAPLYKSRKVTPIITKDIVNPQITDVRTSDQLESDDLKNISNELDSLS